MFNFAIFVFSSPFPFSIFLSKKQGAYGKIQTHKESKLSQLMHVSEVWSAVKFLYLTPLPSNMVMDTPDLEFCEEILVAVSRSFAAVIRQLPANIGIDVAIFYLVLRALDTVEDDTTAFASHDEKVKHLLAFTTNALQDPTWSVDGVGHGDERRLLQEFPKVHRVYAGLPECSRLIITDITQRMAAGMAEFVTKDLGQGTANIPEYNRYCHFVAGLVGEGLSRLFSACGLEKQSLGQELKLSDQMGLFLQKTNILRDFLEDYVDQRAFWPQSVWKKYSPTGDLGYFCNQDDPIVRRNALACLNELVADALELAPDCLAYMSHLQCTEVFRFCAIPQVMAIATLEKIYNNPNVFTGVVKIRKGLSCKLILRTNNLAELHETFYDFTRRIMNVTKANVGSCSADRTNTAARTIQACEAVLQLTHAKASLQKRARMGRLFTIFAVMFAVLLWQFVPVATTILEDTLASHLTMLIQAFLIVGASAVYCGVGPYTVRSNLKTADLLMGRTVV
jgi:farnesyl-diphosphate farnesyltransferase